MEVLVLIVVGIAAYYLVRFLRKEKYFRSAPFLIHRMRLQEVVAEHNELVDYIDEIRASGTFVFGASSTGRFAHLATGTNTSTYKYRRDRNVATLAPNVHQCSLQITRKAQQEPIKYLMKYFGFTADEPTLERVEALGESIAQLEQAVANLQAREQAMIAAVEPPRFITRHYMDEFLAQLGASFSQIAVPYPTYTFEYVSAGGNSSQRSQIVLDSDSIDALVRTMSDKIRWRASAAGQRALMTTRLREEIKERDGYTCRACGLSTYDEPNLLLEVDHIVPVSQGGRTVRANLQALCWRCNRSKSNKIAA